MSEDKIKCPICGTKNDCNAEKCKMCKTLLSKKENGQLKVSSPKSRGKTITIIDIEDPLTRKKLEELTLIPGVNRKKALLLYQSGIHSMEEFLQKAFHGERMSENYSRTVANKLLVQSLKQRKASENIECPSCKAPNPHDTERCNVCNFNIKKEMDSINMTKLTGKLNESVSEILESLSKSEDFDALPDEMKTQFASIIDSDDVDLDMEKPKEIETLGIDLASIDATSKETADAMPETASAGQSEGEINPVDSAIEDEAPGKEPEITPTQPEKTSDESPKKKSEDSTKAKTKDKAKEKQEKVRKILTDKMVQWRKAGYDVAPLEDYLENIEGFKLKAKEVLSQGKTVKAKCLNQLDMWRKKGFDVSELEPLIETDLDAFAEKAKEVLKKQKKNK
jgi:hypothetical protein